MLKSVRKSSFHVGNIIGKADGMVELSFIFNNLEGENFGLTTRFKRNI